MEEKEGKLCPRCEQTRPLNNFNLEGDGRLDAEGNPKRRKICSACRSEIRRQQRKEKLLGASESGITESTSTKDEDQEDIGELLVGALVELARYDLERLEHIQLDEFVRKTHSEDLVDELSFPGIKDKAKKRLLELGFYHPAELQFGKGTYLVVGDSHGKHTKTKMFNLLKNFNRHGKFDKIIHLGHILDDDNVISYHWQAFDNLVVLARIEESVAIEKNLQLGFGFEVCRNKIKLGKLNLVNQDLITDYVKTFIGHLDQHIFPGSVIANGHRHELDTRCQYKGTAFVGSPGSLCEQHIVKTIKQIDFTAGYQIKQARADSFIKYRRMRDMYRFWQQGAFVVHVDEAGDFSIVPVMIKKVANEYVTSYFDKIITESEVVEPDLKIFVNGDMHCDNHDNRVLDIQDKVVADYKPDIYVNLGDMQNNRAINHHEMERGEVISKDIIEENAMVSYVMRRTSKWAKINYVFYGNHERFIRDYVRKHPQLGSLFNLFLQSFVEAENFKLVGHKDVLEIGPTKFVHGDMRQYGQKGTFLERAARTFGADVLVGHQHFCGMRMGGYEIGLTGKLDQGYNEPNASKWVHGFALVNQYKSEGWVSNLSVVDHKTLLNYKTYSSVDDKAWELPDYRTRIVYEFVKK